MLAATLKAASLPRAPSTRDCPNMCYGSMWYGKRAAASGLQACSRHGPWRVHDQQSGRKNEYMSDDMRTATRIVKRKTAPLSLTWHTLQDWTHASRGTGTRTAPPDAPQRPHMHNPCATSTRQDGAHHANGSKGDLRPRRMVYRRRGRFVSRQGGGSKGVQPAGAT
eukprot:4410366-Alexandrium_andersonii.AAC.1